MTRDRRVRSVDESEPGRASGALPYKLPGGSGDRQLQMDGMAAKNAPPNILGAAIKQDEAMCPSRPIYASSFLFGNVP